MKELGIADAVVVCNRIHGRFPVHLLTLIHRYATLHMEHVLPIMFWLHSFSQGWYYRIDVYLPTPLILTNWNKLKN